MHKNLLKNKVETIFKIVCLISLSVLFYVCLDYEDDEGIWFQFHETFYIAAPITAILVAFSIPSDWSVIISFGIAQFLVSIDFFEDILFNSFSILPPPFSLNPQYTKIFLYLIAFSILLPSLFLKKKRINKILALLLISVNVVLVLNNHFSFPDGILRDLVETRKSEISLVAKEENKANLGIICKSMNLSCRIFRGETSETLTWIEINEDFQGHYNQMKYMNNLPDKIFIVDTNRNPSLYARFKRSDGFILEIFDPYRIKKYWSMNVFYFYRNSALISCGWFMFFMILGWLHRRVSR